MEKENNMENSTEKKERKVYKVVQGNFNYGGHSKNYGLFFAVLDGAGPTVEKIDLALGKNKKLIEIDLKISSKIFVEALKEAKEKEVYESQKLALDLKSSLDTEDLEEILRAIDTANIDKIVPVFKEEIENSFQEQVQMDIEYTTVTKEELAELYPELFADEKDSDTNSDLTKEEVADEEEYSKENIITLKSSAIISPARGKKADQLNIGDQIAVKITDGSEKAKRLKKSLHNDDGFAKAEIKDLVFNKDSNRYSISVHLRAEIYGELIVGPQVKLAVPGGEDDLSSKDKTSIKSSSVDDKLIILFAMAGIVIIILIIFLGIYL